MSIEKCPELRIVGNASPEEKKETEERLQKSLFSHFEALSPQERERIQKSEYEKSEKIIGLIDFANQETNRLRREAGLDPYVIPYENYHLLPSELFQEFIHRKGISAGAFYGRQGIFLNAEKYDSDPVRLGSAFLHETLHLKGHLAVEVREEDNETKRSLFRTGVTAFGEQAKEYHAHFTGLHEAIVSAQEKKSFSRMINSPLLKEEKEWLMFGEAQEMIRRTADRLKISKDEFMWVSREGRGILFYYHEHRKVLDFICSEVQKEYPQQYREKEDVFKEFLKSHFTGRLLPIAKLMEKTFGKGSFRKLGDMEDNDKSAVSQMKLLKKVRAKQLENN